MSFDGNMGVINAFTHIEKENPLSLLMIGAGYDEKILL